MIVHNVRIGEDTSQRDPDRAHKRIYVGGAESDLRYRDMLVNGRHRWELYSKPTIDLVTLDRHGVDLERHKPVVEEVIRGVDGVMIIVSEQTAKDPLALWEIDCSLAHHTPCVGVDVRPIAEGIVPETLAGKIVKFGWEWFADFFNDL